MEPVHHSSNAILVYSVQWPELLSTELTERRFYRCLLTSFLCVGVFRGLLRQLTLSLTPHIDQQ